MSWVDAFFSWPGGAVWGNLLASAITVVPGLAVHHRRVVRKLDAHHARVEAHLRVPGAAADRQEAAR